MVKASRAGKVAAWQNKRKAPVGHHRRFQACGAGIRVVQKKPEGIVRLRNASIGFERLDVDGLFASLGFPDFKSDLVIFLKPEKTKLFDAGVVYENFADFFRGDEPITLFRVVPFDTTFCHEISPFEMPCAKAQEVIWEGDPL